VVSGSCRASVVLAQPQRALYAIGRHRADLRCMSRAGGLVACGALTKWQRSTRRDPYRRLFAGVPVRSRLSHGRAA
jgi:hypothetical protein